MEASAQILPYCKDCSEPDASSRAELFASVWAPHTPSTDPCVHAANAKELRSHFAKIQACRPGASVVGRGKADVHPSLARSA